MGATRIEHPANQQAISDYLLHFEETPGIEVNRYIVFVNPPSASISPDTPDLGTHFPSSAAAAVNQISNNAGPSWVQAEVVVNGSTIGPASLGEIVDQAIAIQSRT